MPKPNSQLKSTEPINDVVTSVNIPKSTGGAITDPLGVWESFKLKQTFVLPNGRVKEIRPLSSLEMTLRSLETDIDLLDQKWSKKVATATVDDQEKVITVTMQLSQKNGQCDRETAFLCACRPQVVKDQRHDFTHDR